MMVDNKERIAMQKQCLIVKRCEHEHLVISSALHSQAEQNALNFEFSLVSLNALDWTELPNNECYFLNDGFKHSKRLCKYKQLKKNELPWRVAIEIKYSI